MYIVKLRKKKHPAGSEIERGGDGEWILAEA
jgi:hypothetical protein